jgi:hypothetical protein
MEKQSYSNFDWMKYHLKSADIAAVKPEDFGREL